MKILLTGGPRLLRRHKYVAAGGAGDTPGGPHNFANSHPRVLERLQRITGKPVTCEEGDVADQPFVAGVFKRHDIKGVVHFAADKAVGESVAQPLKYYRNNICGAVSLFESMMQA